MKCIKCNGTAVIHIDNIDACRGCYLEIIQKRVRKEIRISGLIEKNDELLLIDDGSAEAKLSIHLIKEIVKDPTIKLTIKKQKYSLGDDIRGKQTKVVIPWNADMEGAYLLDSFFEKKKLKYLANFRIGKKTYIKPLIHVMHKEAGEFCNILKLKFTEKKAESNADKMIDKLQEEYKEIIFSLVKSSEEIKNKIQKS